VVGFFDFLFPKYCLGCGQNGQYFCPSCSVNLRPTTQICPVCEQLSTYGLTHPSCRSQYQPDGLSSLFAFEGITRKAIHQLKYRLLTDLVPEFVSLIFQEIEKQAYLKKFIKKYHPLVIPIPLYWYKENQRGFNQSALFGQAIARQFNLPFSEKILKRKRATPSQTTLSLKQRKENVKNVFSVSLKKENIEPNILLVDDVWTTGATLKTAAKLLKQKGVKKLWGLTIAR